jgi:hypothetical protein
MKKGRENNVISLKGWFYTFNYKIAGGTKAKVCSSLEYVVSTLSKCNLGQLVIYDSFDYHLFHIKICYSHDNAARYITAIKTVMCFPIDSINTIYFSNYIGLNEVHVINFEKTPQVKLKLLLKVVRIGYIGTKLFGPYFSEVECKI